jgi:hypothetical protein
MKIKQIETHIGITLMGSVTTCIDSERFKCDIDWALGAKGDTIGFHVKHKGKHIGIPFTNVKQWVLIDDANTTTGTLKAS